MFKKKKAQKDSNMTYFLGGTAVGMAAGLLFGKLFSNTPDENTQNYEPEHLINKNRNKYSQDDNIHNLHIEKKTQNCRIRSKSASQYEQVNNCTEQAMLLNKFEKDINYNMNNLDTGHKCDKNMQKILHDNKNHTSYNISTEDVKHTLHKEIITESSKNEKVDNNQLLRYEDTEKKIQDSASIKEDYLVKDINIASINDDNNKRKNNEITQNLVKTENSIELTDTFNSLSIDFCKNLTICVNLQDTKDSTNYLNIAPDYVENSSIMATYNDSKYFNNDEDIDKLNCTSTDEFSESQLISSTKQDNFDEI